MRSRYFRKARRPQTGSLALAAVACLFVVGAAQAAFNGPFAPAKWTSGTNLLVDLAEAPGAVRLMCAPGADTNAEWVTTSPCDAVVSFDWQYTPASDAAGRQDSAGYRVGSETVTLTTGASTGSATIKVSKGNVFAFWVRTEGKPRSPGKLMLKNFRFTVNPSIEQIALNPGGVQLKFTSTPGLIHRVQACSDLRTGNWVDVSPDILAMDAETFYQHGRKAGDMMFYRVFVPAQAE